KVTELLESRRPLPRRERRTRLDDQDILIPQELDRLERPFGNRQIDKRQIDGPSLERVDQDDVTRLLHELDSHVRTLLRELAQEIRHDLRPNALVDADPEQPARPGEVRREVGLSSCDASRDALRMP